MKTTINVKTFGCKLNHYDSLLIKKRVQNLDLSQKKNVFILNSCAVTAQAGKDIRKEAEKIKKSHPDSLIVLTGCGAQVETELYKNTKSVDLIIGNSDRKNLANIIKNFSPQQKNKVFKSNIFKITSVYSDFVSPAQDRTRAFLKIQDGCDSFCTFCIIPFARGKSKSISMDFLVKAVKKLEEEDVKEVVLTGVHIGDYKDGDKGLDDLLVYLLTKTNIPRIRLTSLEPIEITDKLLDCWKDDRVCSHFHISLQSASSSVLKFMKRKYGRKEVEAAFYKIDQIVPHAFVGIDIIAGFPYESKEDFEESYKVLKDHPWTNLHVFPYSPRKGTYAYKYRNLPQKEVAQRASLLRDLSEIRFNNHIKKQVGTHKKILLFKKDNRRGLSRDYWKIKVPPSSRKGEHKVLIEGIDQKKGWLKGVWF